MNTKRIKTILFDVGDVLLKKTVNIDEQISSFLGVDLEKYVQRQKGLINSDKKLQENWQHIETLEKEILYMNDFNAKLLDVLSIEKTRDKIDFMTACHVKRSYKLVDGAFELLNYLNEKYQLGVISNCLVSRKYYEMKEFDLDKYFDTVVLSREINIDKPNPGIFLYALEQVKKEPGECAFIDNKVENLESAKKLGFGELIFFSKKGRVIDVPSGIKRVASLVELREVF